MPSSYLHRITTLSLYSLWGLLFCRLLNAALYEIRRLCESNCKGESSAAWIKIEKVFSQISRGPLVAKSMALALTPDGSKLYCPVSHLNLLMKTIYFREMYDRFFAPNNGDTIADVGAHVGMYTLKAARKVKKRGLILSFEPHPYTFKLLITNLKMNGFSQNVIPMNIGLADFKGKARLYLASKEVGHSLAESDREKWIEVQVNSLDSVMEELGLSQLDLLKVDVEGYELEVLKGAENTLKNTSKVVVAAYHYAGEVEAVKKLLKSKGFDNVVSSDVLHVYAWR